MSASTFEGLDRTSSPAGQLAAWPTRQTAALNRRRGIGSLRPSKVAPPGLADKAKPPLECPQTHKLIAFEVLLTKSMLNHLPVQLLHAALESILELEIR